MQITLVCVGKLKERYFAEAAKEYEKRLSRYGKLSIVEVQDEKIPEKEGEAARLKVKEKECGRIQRAIRDAAYVVALDPRGKKLSSEGFADFLRARGLQGDGRLVFVIGGALGLDGGVLARADLALSFSDMTFPHQLARVLLLEQLYRAMRILHGAPYHK